MKLLDIPLKRAIDYNHKICDHTKNEIDSRFLTDRRIGYDQTNFTEQLGELYVLLLEYINTRN